MRPSQVPPSVCGKNRKRSGNTEAAPAKAVRLAAGSARAGTRQQEAGRGLFIQDECDHLDWLVAQAFQAVALAGGAVGHVTGADFYLGAVVVVQALAAQDVIGLAVACVDMVADFTTGVDGGVAKHAALLAHLLGAVQQAADGDLAHAVKRGGLADGLLFFTATDHRCSLLINKYCGENWWLKHGAIYLQSVSALYA